MIRAELLPESKDATPRLLLVDDETSVRMTLAAILTKEGYEVTAVASGTEALALLQEGTFEVVVSDMRLDDVEGLAILSEARERNPEVVTIVLTGYASLESAVDAIRRGVFGYLIKPCKLDEMRSVIREGLEARRASRVNRQVEIAEAVAEARQRAMRDFEVEKGTWLSAISHDLKGPLTTVKGTVQWLRRKDRFRDEGRLLEAFNSIDLTVSRMARMIDELCDIGETDHRRLNLEQHDLADLVKCIVAEHQPTTDRHVIEIDCRADGLSILCDGPQMERVIGNLLSNAVKYSPAPGTIRVTLDRDGRHNMAVLEVEDHGLGIPAAELHNIFTRFYRGTNVSEHIPGTGIGLAGSQQILEAHGATIEVDSQEGKGSTFTVRIPLANAGSATSADEPDQDTSAALA
ncbi:MAG TPA: hybrid sensor histidine kinase/response regulator [Chloroflexota bacterium]|nr:hybrid sensor histidine kinase/response regulator [Chloroflexota bacterium]